MESNSGLITRRSFLRFVAQGLTVGSLIAQGKEQVEQPNIIFLLTDDQRARTMSGVGHPVIRTPNLDRLTASGIRFTNAFVTEPTCMPSRVTFLTGQYERVHGVGFSSGNSLTETQWSNTYPALLRENGYYTGFIGKFGVERYAFRGNAQTKFDFWRGHDGWARFFAKTAGNCKIYSDSEEDIITPIMGKSMERFLDSCPQGKPFCLSVSFSAPHGSISGSMVPEEGGGDQRMTRPAHKNPLIAEHPVYGALYRNDSKVRIPAETATDPSPHLSKEVLPQEERRKCYSYNYTKETCLEHHYRYYQLITGIDRAVGRFLDDLKKRGLEKNTIIIYTSDHGLLMGEYGMGGKALLYDLTTRVPFIIHDPRLPKSKQGMEIHELVLSNDVAPTILSYAGVPVPVTMQGRDLNELIDKPNQSWRSEIFLENLYVGRHNPLIEAIRTKRWKYIRYFSNPGRSYQSEDVDFTGREPMFEQLFDLQHDPQEKQNLAHSPEHVETLSGLRERCQRHSSRVTVHRVKTTFMAHWSSFCC